MLGNVEGERRPQPFVEDTAVPPENLAAYIAEFRALLDGMQVDYGMFGHVDAGVLHVRPALDMKNPQDAAKIKPITDQVAALVHKHGGVLWGEHGKGLRSEYAPQFFWGGVPVDTASQSDIRPLQPIQSWQNRHAVYPKTRGVDAGGRSVLARPTRPSHSA